MFTHSVFASMLLCVHGWPFDKVKLRNDERRVESVQCSHCGNMHTDTAWYSQCCWNAFTKRYEDVSILNEDSFCMLCNNCFVQLRVYREQLCKVDYHADFEFYDQYGNEM